MLPAAAASRTPRRRAPKSPAAIGLRGDRAADLQVVVDHLTDKARVLNDLLKLSGRQLQGVHVVQLRIVLVQADEHIVRKVLTVGDEPALHIVHRSEVTLYSRLQVDVVDAEVLASVLIPHVHEVAVVLRPEVALDPTGGVPASPMKTLSTPSTSATYDSSPSGEIC